MLGQTVNTVVLQPHLEWAPHVKTTGRIRAGCESTRDGMKQNKASVEELRK